MLFSVSGLVLLNTSFDSLWSYVTAFELYVGNIIWTCNSIRNRIDSSHHLLIYSNTDPSQPRMNVCFREF